MGFFKFFQQNDTTSAKVAKDRLQVLIAHERSGRDGPDYLPMLRQDILNVIKKYVAVDDEALTVQVESQNDCDVLELNITLPEESLDERRPSVSRRAGDGGPRASSGGGSSSGPKTMPSEEARRRAAARRQGQAAG